ncbi:DUF6795 domain-containing protein [Pseudoalteromonas sp. T1lg48]|uniref:DUF6795 domain-containing protein n=1 Tax=Pseudoalteromonas sp. T1lg48 TaxID=2077100 RepID=UPI000CF73C58|nr:DUF6795 domain-containing protein [Pseudoalteromonas sp. T1lg48]
MKFSQGVNMRLIVSSLLCAGILACAFLFFTQANSSRTPLSQLLLQAQTLSPQIQGRIAMGDTRLANVKVTRTLSIGEQHFVSQAITDEQGQFSFAALTSDEPLLGRSTDRLWQDISLYYQGQQYVLWYTAIDHEMDNFVVQETLSQLDCNLLWGEDEFSINDKRRLGLPVNVYSICDLAPEQVQKKPLI